MIKPDPLCFPTALAALFALAGCSSLDNCPEGRDDIVAVPDDQGHWDVANSYYESAAWDGPLDAFPAKTELSFTHHLGVTPLLVKAYLAFAPNGTNGAGGGSVAEVAGNEVLYECVDSNLIVIKNDTCERSFFVRVVAEGAEPDSIGAGGDSNPQANACAK
jgi:hypothetical protein